AGSTDSSTHTQWICLDLDGIEGYDSVSEFLEDINCADTDYILQWSSSMNIEQGTGLRCHVFMLLDAQVTPQILKHWLTGLNLNTPILRTQLVLTKTNNSLLWPLDITTCQNDKLLYVAPPELSKDIKDPFTTTKRISQHDKQKRRLKLPTNIESQESLRSKTDSRVAELRLEANLPKRKPTKYKFTGTTEYASNPDTAVITGTKIERGFVYLNLNGGDSWAYFHPEDNPTFISNFKGEPSYKTEDLLPEYWAKKVAENVAHKPTADGTIYFAFRDFKSSNYFNGTYNLNTNALNLAMAKSESQLRHFMSQHGQFMGEFVPDWDILWDPKQLVTIDTEAKTLNQYKPSKFQNLKRNKKVTQIPPTIYKVIENVLGGDPPTITRFINWVAVIVQKKTSTGTAWVLQGTQGTGKGVLFHHILTPILGVDNTTAKRMEELESEFTGFMENKFLVFIDEIESGKSLYHSKINAKLKNLIVEPTISIRKMYQLPYMAVNYSNIIFASNKPAAVEIPPDDRRFNVGGYQTNPLRITGAEVNELIPTELEDFYNYLHNYKISVEDARTPILNTAKARLVEINRTAVDSVSDALNTGDLQFFIDQLPNDPDLLSPIESFKYGPYNTLLNNILQSPPDCISRDEIGILLDWCIGNIPKSPHKLTSYLNHHNINMVQIWKNGKNTRGITIKWGSPTQ
ncbi:MAG: hypothetical protein DRQ64_09135, partial [Gammaproteobacteria bacterium]